MQHRSSIKTTIRMVTALVMVPCAWGTGSVLHAQIDTAALARHARTLAADSFEGRGPATAGEAMAARYIVAALRAAGLGPIPGQPPDLRIPVPLTAYVEVATPTMVLTSAGGTRTISPPTFYNPGGGAAAFDDFSGTLLFAGAVPGALAALQTRPDLHDRVVVLGPPCQGLEQVEAELLRRGAAGTVQAVPNGAVYERLRVARGPTRFALRGHVNDPHNQGALPAVVVGPDGIAALGLQDELAPGRTLERARALNASISVQFAVRPEARTGHDVAAYLPGADPARRAQVVVLMAHYDHVGIVPAAGGDSIWNGFVDNAAGTAMVLELARVLSERPPARSVIFLFTTAEEQGSLGADWFVHEAPVPVDRIAAVLNLDGGAPPAPPTDWVLAGGGESPPGDVAADALRAAGWTVRTRPLIPDSDHWAFRLAGVPALFLYAGNAYEDINAAQADSLWAEWSHPHTPDDEWRPGFPFSGLDRYAQAAERVVRALGTAEVPSR